MDWTPWRKLSPTLSLSERTLQELLDGGQSFRWNLLDGAWEGVFGKHVARLRLNPRRQLEWSSPTALEPTTGDALGDYLALNAAWEQALDALPWRSDVAIAKALEHWRGLRILRQPLAETLLCFLCSSTKQIVQIKQICEDLALRFGEAITETHHSLPDWEAIHRADEEALRACRLGYRARYLKGTAAYLAERPDWLSEIDALPYPEARTRLIELPGVGGKIADCVLLFGAGKLAAFPVDTWMLKAMARRYGLDGWKPEQVAQFGRVHFGSNAGVAQQFIFADERRVRG